MTCMNTYFVWWFNHWRKKYGWMVIPGFSFLSFIYNFYYNPRCLEIDLLFWHLSTVKVLTLKCLLIMGDIIMRTGSTYPSGAPEITPCLWRVRIPKVFSFVYYCLFFFFLSHVVIRSFSINDLKCPSGFFRLSSKRCIWLIQIVLIYFMHLFIYQSDQFRLVSIENKLRIFI